MEGFATWFLLSFSAWLGVTPTPSDFAQNWKIVQDWQFDGHGYVMKAQSTSIASLCDGNSNGSILFPRVIHGANRITVNSHVVLEQGDFAFETAAPFYEQAVVGCNLIPKNALVVWETSSYSKYFARFAASPTVVRGHSFRNFLNVDSNLISAAVLIVLSVLSVFLFANRIPNQLLVSIALGSLLSAAYFLNCANARLGLPISMLASHKLADFCLWTGVYLFLYGFYIESLLPRWALRLFAGSLGLAFIVFLIGTTGSQVQLGTMIPMLPYCIIFGVCAHRLVTRQAAFDFQNIVRLSALLAYFFAGVNDLVSVSGLIDGNFLFCLGIVGGYFGMAVAVNRDIDKTYQERDSLLHDLEDKVTEKTKHLSEALSTLKTTQAELVQSAKLASLGTLSAGVAHEINNSINYVSGALKPLERKIKQLIPESDQPQIDKLLGAIKEGTSLTVGIVNSLRVYTGLNQAAFKQFDMRDIVNSALTILKSKARNISIKVEIAPNSVMHGSVVGVSQIVMNLISNAIDALPADNAEIAITTTVSEETLTLTIRDNGTGIPKAIADRIFEPFFTTKEVGKGTGLGLHIVLKEIERHHGKIDLKTIENQGTEFIMTFPRLIKELKEAA